VLAALYLYTPYNAKDILSFKSPFGTSPECSGFTTGVYCSKKLAEPELGLHRLWLWLLVVHFLPRELKRLLLQCCYSNFEGGAGVSGNPAKEGLTFEDGHPDEIKGGSTKPKW
jgi:hypothetical protein